MYREPISRPESNGYFESGFPNNDLMLPKGRTELPRSDSEFVFLHGTTVNTTEPEAYTDKLPEVVRPDQRGF